MRIMLVAIHLVENLVLYVFNARSQVETQQRRFAVPVATTSFTLRECFAHALTVGWDALDDSASNEILNFALSLG